MVLHRVRSRETASIVQGNRWCEPFQVKEIHRLREIAGVSTDVQVCLLDYRPAFKRCNPTLPTIVEIAEIKKTLNDAGLITGIVQTLKGYNSPL